MNENNILIAGGSGLIGKALSEYLELKGYKVAVLTRKINKSLPLEQFEWNPDENRIDPAAMSNKNIIINLSGSGILDKRWSDNYKKEIIRSRVQSASLLMDEIKKHPSVVQYISASAVGYYGMDTGAERITESHKAGNDFLSEVVQAWENALLNMPPQVKTGIIRIGVVLADNGGALQKMLAPIKLGLGSPLGSGNQFIPWIHIMDLCSVFDFYIENKISGITNAVAPNPVTNKVFTKHLAELAHRPLLLPNVPAFALKLILGKEESGIVLGGNNVFPERLINEGFSFVFPEINSALKDLLLH